MTVSNEKRNAGHHPVLSVLYFSRHLFLPDIRFQEVLPFPDGFQDLPVDFLGLFFLQEDHVKMAAVVMLETDRVPVVVHGVQEEGFVPGNAGGGIGFSVLNQGAVSHPG